MGWKASLIIVQRPEPAIPEEELLHKLGFTNVTPSGNTTLEECIHPQDKSLNIGFYNGCLLLADDHQLTEDLDLTNTPDRLAKHEQILTALYPGGEILSVACHSAVNYHLYSLVHNGQKIRYKKVVSGEEVVEYGDRLPEEQEIYATSTLVNGQRMFRDPYRDDNVYDLTEDQLMESFTFGVAKRLLGVEIATGDDEELMDEIIFHKYRSVQQTAPKTPAPLPRNQTPLPRKLSWWERLFGK
jgi:hypothetical protein